MGWRVMSKIPEMQPLGQGPRRWPFVALLLAVIVLGSSSWFYCRIAPEYNDQRSGGNLLSTPSQMMYNPFGQNYTFERAVEILNCSNHNWLRRSSKTLPSNNTIPLKKDCPSYFHWIRRDLAPWKDVGITQTDIETAGKEAALKVIIVDSKLYIDRHAPCFANRAVFTVWGLLLLLEKYKGQVPDVELVFNCEDQPRIKKAGGAAVPLFSYCSNTDHYDIPFPDWSFWGWSELMIDSWDKEREEIVKGSRMMDWNSKVPNAYWTGNPFVGSPNRVELLSCNGASKAEIHTQDWRKELPLGKQNSKLEDQCNHRYMIYAEGIGWSVSLKYIISCGSPVLAIAPAFYDFFSRGLQPWVHFMPVRPSEVRAPELCAALDERVDFGEANTTKAIQIGKAGQDFMREEVDMENVYDYMFHVLREYSSLQKFRPSVPDKSLLITLDRVLCIAEPGATSTLEQAMELLPLSTTPCHMPATPGPQFKESDWAIKVQ